MDPDDVHYLTLNDISLKWRYSLRLKISLGTKSYLFSSLKDLLAKASPKRAADELAQIAAENEKERVAAQMLLADMPLKYFLSETLIDASKDEVSALIEAQFNEEAFKEISHHTVGSFREYLLLYGTDGHEIKNLHFALTPEMVAAVSKIMRNQDLITVAKKCHVITKFRNTIGLPGHLGVRLQPNHPTDDEKGILLSTLDGLSLGAGDAVIGINPVSENLPKLGNLLHMLDEVRQKLDIPTQTCVLTHITNAIELMQRNAPIDLVFQSIAGSEQANRHFGVDLSMLKDAYEMAKDLKRGTIGDNVMYFETGQGSALSASAHHDVDAQTIEARAYAVAREFQPLLVNSVVGFIGPEYLFDGKEITRAALEDHFCAKLLGLPMGVDVCYTNHAEADQNDMDNLLTLLGVAGCSYIMGVPGADDIMLNYQSTSFHDALYLRHVLKLKPAPEFLAWLKKMGVMDETLLLNDHHQKFLSSFHHGF